MKEDHKSAFTFHKPDEKGVADMRSIRRTIRELVCVIDELCPENREKSLALSHLQTVMMFANSSIVQQYPLDEKDI